MARDTQAQAGARDRPALDDAVKRRGYRPQPVPPLEVAGGAALGDKRRPVRRLLDDLATGAWYQSAIASSSIGNASRCGDESDGNLAFNTSSSPARTSTRVDSGLVFKIAVVAASSTSPPTAPPPSIGAIGSCGRHTLRAGATFSEP
jgi:hypothetical protein